MKNIKVSEKFNDRVDKFLKKEIFFNSKLTRRKIIEEIKKGNIVVNGRAIKPSYILRRGDEISVGIKEEKFKLIPNKDVEFEIISEEKNFIVINKAAGLQVHPSVRGERKTLVSGLIYRFPEIKNVGDDLQYRPGIVHRLDKETSGIMLIARNQEAFLKLKEKFKNHEIEKTYWAIVNGKMVAGEEGVISKPIARAANYKKQVIAGRKTKTIIREAVTHYKVLKSEDEYSLIEVMPKTGRMHQIRVHLAFIGHPVVGDKLYGNKKNEGQLSAARQLLHAKKLAFELNGKDFEFEAPLPADFPVDEKGILR